MNETIDIPMRPEFQGYSMAKLSNSFGGLLISDLTGGPVETSCLTITRASNRDNLDGVLGIYHMPNGRTLLFSTGLCQFNQKPDNPWELFTVIDDGSVEEYTGLVYLFGWMCGKLSVSNWYRPDCVQYFDQMVLEHPERLKAIKKRGIYACAVTPFEIPLEDRAIKEAMDRHPNLTEREVRHLLEGAYGFNEPGCPHINLVPYELVLLNKEEYDYVSELKVEGLVRAFFQAVGRKAGVNRWNSNREIPWNKSKDVMNEFTELVVENDLVNIKAQIHENPDQPQGEQPC